MDERKPEALSEVRVRVPRAQVELLSDFVIENVCHGIVIEDDESSPSVGVIFYVTPNEADRHVSSVRARLVGLVGEEQVADDAVTVREIKNLAWEEEYRRSIVPVVVAGDVVIRPPWAQAPSFCTYDIVIEPKMAFGTGTHETTRSCLQIIRQYLKPGVRFLDLGCGSGILSILADKMGASFIKAIDYDVVAVDNCRENFQMNGLRAPYDVQFGSIEKARNDQPYQFVVANIIKSTILDLLPQLLAATGRPGLLVLSGLLEQDIAEIEIALDRLGVRQRTMLADNEWRTFTVRVD